MNKQMKLLKKYVSGHTRSKRPILVGPLKHKRVRRKKIKYIVSATQIYNYMMRDPLVDWLKFRKLHKEKSSRHFRNYLYSKCFTDFIMERGVEFESELIKYININLLPIVSISDTITPQSLSKTKELMLKGVPALHSAPVKNIYNNTQGIVDLLVRSDYLSKIVDEEPLTDTEKIIPSPKLGKPYHYIVIDIKYSTLPLRADGKHLLNSGSYPAYKAQCLIYSEAVGCIQGYTAPHAFIMGRRWKYNKGGVINHNYTCLNRLGKIDYNGIDSEFKIRTKEAIKWVRDVKENGSSWSISPPSRIELYPNMCVDSGDEWNKEKREIAEQIGEMTNIWYVGLKHRNSALEKGIKSWHDNRCNTSIMGLRGVRAPIIDAILDINRQNKDKIRPKKIISNIHGWKKVNNNDLYVDFETLSDIFADFNHLPEQYCTDMIFMIGVGYQENDQFKYINFICNSPTYDEEYRIMNEFSQFVAERGYPNIYHWVAESRFWNTASCRQFDLADEEGDMERKIRISDSWNINKWADLSQLFKSEPIVIKDCFKFGLKAVAGAMQKHGMISSIIDSSCDSGLSAMVNAWKAYKNYDNPETSEIMKDISKYNEYDVRVLWEILTYLRNNHL